MALDGMAVAAVLERLVPRGPQAELRLVGTASSALRGIELPAGDIDILFRNRVDVDGWYDAVRPIAEVRHAPRWLTESQQYFARLELDETVIELSTVEIETEAGTMECFGLGPWRHFDNIACGDFTIPAVTSELRLVTEVARERRDRWMPIARYLASTPCDRQLVLRGLADHAVARDLSRSVLRVLDNGNPASH